MDRPPMPYNFRGRAGPSSQELPNAEEGWEYKCKYCPMAFTTKQALGGHQNAHKRQRAMEKTARERANSHFSYYDSTTYPGLYPAPHNRLQDFTEGMHMGYDAHPRMPLPRNPYERGPINISSRSSGSRSRPVYPDLSVFAAPRDHRGEGLGEEQGEDDDGLDLSLKL